MINTMTVNGVQLAYRVDGPPDAPPLVLINSLGTDMRMWDGQVAALSHLRRVVRYDTRGHGGSDVPAGPYTLEQLGNDLLGLLDALGIARANVCGLSLGGITALWLAAHHPQRIERAVFANTAARIGTPEAWNARIAAVRAGGMAAVRDVVIARFLSAEFRAAHPETAHAFGEMLAATDPAGYVAACAAVRDADLRSLVPTIHLSSLIIAGTLDESTPPAQSDELHAAIAGSELAVLYAAHLSNVEQPEQFTARVLAFLNA